MSSASWGLASLACALARLGEAFVVLQDAAPAQLCIHAQDARIALSGAVRLRLSVVAGKDLEVQPLASGRLEPNWRLVAGKATAAEDAGRMRWLQEIQAEPLRPGDLSLELPPLRYREGAGPWQVVEWKPIHIKVQTAAIADVKDLRDIAAIERLTGRPDRDAWTAWIVSAASAIILLVLIVGTWQWRKVRPTATASPEETALRGLERIAALRLAENGAGARLHVLLHDVVRRYLRRRFQIAARARTSAELRERFATAKLSGARRRLLDQFLERCDRAKFAGVALSVVDCRETAELAREIITCAIRNSDERPQEVDNPASIADRERDGS